MKTIEEQVLEKAKHEAMLAKDTLALTKRALNKSDLSLLQEQFEVFTKNHPEHWATYRLAALGIKLIELVNNV